MKKILLILVPVIMLSSAGCRHKTDFSDFNLAGTWQEKETAPSFAGSNYRITFLKDKAFELYLSIFTDELPINHNDSCEYGHLEYIKGTYSISGDILTLSGNYCDPQFLVNQLSCSGAISFLEEHQMAFEGLRLVLNPGAGDYERIVMDKQ